MEGEVLVNSLSSEGEVLVDAGGGEAGGVQRQSGEDEAQPVQ